MISVNQHVWVPLHLMDWSHDIIFCQKFIWPDVTDRPCLIHAGLLTDLLFIELNSWSKFSRNSAVWRASSEMNNRKKPFLRLCTHGTCNIYFICAKNLLCTDKTKFKTDKQLKSVLLPAITKFLKFKSLI